MKKKFLFVESLNPYDSEMLVIAGVHPKKEILKWCKKNKTNPKFVEWLLKNIDDWNEDMKEKNKGQFCWGEETYKGQKMRFRVLMLREYFDAWEYWETLIHELHHAVLQLAEQKCFH